MFVWIKSYFYHKITGSEINKLLNRIGFCFIKAVISQQNIANTERIEPIRTHWTTVEQESANNTAVCCFFKSYIICVWAYIRHKNTSTNNRYLCWMYVCVFVWLANKRATDRTNEWMNVRAMESWHCLHDNCALCVRGTATNAVLERREKEREKNKQRKRIKSCDRPMNDLQLYS